MSTTTWIQEQLKISADKTGEITMPIGELVKLLDAFHKYKLTEDTCPKCGYWPMIKIDGKFKCEMCEE